MNRFKDDPRVEFVFEVGGSNKKNSSSWILSEWKHPSENRVWGKFLTYYDSKFTKVKRLILDPGKSISMQYHNNRSELWFIESGKGEIRQLNEHNQEITIKQLNLHDYFSVPVNTWHKLINTDDQILSVIEIQYGTICDESDIVRFQ
jgi:mannose-6-phosphate isomerase-like protein (cupin superfamily)